MPLGINTTWDQCPVGYAPGINTPEINATGITPWDESALDQTH